MNSQHLNAGDLQKYTAVGGLAKTVMTPLVGGSMYGGERANHTANEPEPTSHQIAELRREIESIRDLNTIYCHQRPRRHEDQAANEKRKIRLAQIRQHLAALRK
jgi:hypothetical protein